MLVMFVKSLISVINHTLYPCHFLFLNKYIGKPRDLKWRKHQIQRMYDMVAQNEDRLTEALKLDMNKPVNEAMSGDIAPVLDECLYFLKVRIYAKKKKTCMAYFLTTFYRI